jgi:hypothetical protein
MNQIGRLKEWTGQLLPKDDKLNYVYEMHTVREGREERFSVPYNDAFAVAPNILFEPEALNALQRAKDA